MTRRQLALLHRYSLISSFLFMFATTVFLLAAGASQPAAAQEPADPLPGNGRIVFANSKDGHLEIYTMEPDGSDQRRLTTTSASTQNSDPKWSRDGTQIAFVRNVGPAGVYVMNEDGSDARLVIAGSSASRPSWSPDDTQIAYVASTGGNLPLQIFVANADGSGMPAQLTGGPGQGQQFLPEWSPDGSEIVFVSNRATGAEIWAVNVVTRAQRRIIACCEGATGPTWSPDGQTIAFISGVGGAVNIWFVDRDGSNRRRITNDVVAESAMRFSPDGAKLVMQRQGGRLWTMNVDGTGLTQIPPPPNGEHRTPDWQPVFATEEDTVPPVVAGPDNITAEASGPAGATVAFEVSAEDDVDGAVPVTCDWESGSTFPLGTTTVACSAVDSAGNTGVASFTITVADTTPPHIITPVPVTVEGNTTDGAVGVALETATATDNVDPSPTVTNDAPIFFPLGNTVVTWTATDASGNVTSATQVVTVTDTTAPEITIPATMTVEATSAEGALANYDAMASDIVDAGPQVGCEPASGSIFPLGNTTVVCTATDAAGNSANADFTVTIQDTTPPLLSVPTDMTVNATSPDGAYLSFSVSASDVADPIPTVSCAPGADSTFAVGTTTVTCTATDASGNSASGSFTVTVVGASEQLDNLMATIDTFDLSHGPTTSLVSQLLTALSAIDTGDPVTACEALNAFINHVEAQSGKHLTTEQADQLLAIAQGIEAAIGCS